MKKIYINPSTEIIEIETQQNMLATSNMQKKGDYDSGSVVIGARKDQRNPDVWDEEEEEEENW